ncbi:hypothetical protein SCLCIDRAFT_32580 [Scleroderma citrinum Foug A]|uniref:Uncharacterized protein n=1 Tax=Scleroderma citrinum Foug A TaxID=1036808 RepID=A0A0C3D866_9AGAM|nr:hypothetical protein SCLCIDRAFT_32580 [Scleroderma citrinum Foug A]
MSSSYDIDTAYDALDDSTYDVFDLDAYCSSLSPSVPDSEPVPNTSAPGPRVKRYPKTRGHPRPSPTIISPPAVASTSTQPPSVPAQPDKGKGHQRSALTPSSTCSLDPQPSVSTDSVDLTPEQHLCLVWVLKHLDEWFAQGWEPGVDKSRLRALAEVFDSAESIAEGSLSNIRRANLTWRLSDSEGWEKSARSSIMGAIDIQVTVTKILFKDYGESLITSFRSFLGQKEAELGDSGRPSSISGPPLLKEVSRGDLKPNVPKRVRFQGLDSAVRGACDVHSEQNEGGQLLANASDARVPTYDEACRSLAQHLAFISGTTYRQWLNFLFTLLHSLTSRLPSSSSTTNFATFSRVVDASPTPTPSEDFDAFGATPSGTGPPTMTELVDQFMEDLLTQEFCPVVLAEDS